MPCYSVICNVKTLCGVLNELCIAQQIFHNIYFMFPNIWFNRVNISAILSPYLILSICTSRHRFHLTLISLFLLYGLAEYHL